MSPGGYQRDLAVLEFVLPSPVVQPGVPGRYSFERQPDTADWA